jgi:hypothetical protein
MAHPLSRRSVLLGGTALAFLAACKGKKGDDIAVKDDTSTTQGRKDTLSYVQAGNMYLAGIDERITFALFQGVPASLVGADAEVSVQFQKPGTQVLTEPIVAIRKSAGIEDRPYYVVNYEFDQAGDWGVRATVPGMKPGDAVLTINDPTKVPYPVPGQPLPKVKTPTLADPMEVNPICTRSEGTCPWHDRSLHEVLGNGKPTVVLLATPALCQSATCGPVLDILMGARDKVIKDNVVNVVHVEVYKDTTGKTLSPSFAEFKTESEPVLYLADKNGVLVNRFNGPFDDTEARAAVSALLA